MRTRIVECTAITILLLTASAGCIGGGGREPSDANKGPSGAGSGANKNDASSNAAVGSSPLTPAANPPQGEAGYAMILQAIKEVWIKAKDADSFVRVISSTPFRAGDTLRIGTDSMALVYCRQVCELPSGIYTDCCTDSCKVRAQLSSLSGPPEHFMFKRDLSPEKAAELARSETQISSLGLGETATRFLRASLYSSWKLNEAEDELNGLSLQLEKPEARQELNLIYPSVIRKTGDMYVTLNQKDKAVREYEKVIKPPVGSAEVEFHQLDEKAEAHASLAEVYAEAGKKAEAEQNLKAATNIYIKQGDTKKVVLLEKRRAAIIKD